MRLSGIDPGIIRELSGIYKPFIKAFKELISNAYDADSNKIIVTLREDFSDLDVLDDGIGMTPYDFHQDFARLGGSTAWLRGGQSPRGRPRIGYKGIGFLSVARYCGALHVNTYSRRPFTGTRQIARRNLKTIPIETIVGDVVPLSLLDGKIRIATAKGLWGKERVLLEPGRDYLVERHGVRLISPRSLSLSQLDFEYTVNCSHLQLQAILDFDYLLSLERKADLRLLEDFCTVTLKEAQPSLKPYTQVRLHKLKDFVIRDLSAPPLKGKARNIVFKSGKEQFLWRLARSAPIQDDVTPDTACPPIECLAATQASADLPELVVNWREDRAITLTRPVYLPKGDGMPLGETVVPVDIDQGGLRVIGYLLPRSEIIYPAEFRGISIRVRRVAIGDPSFLGWEHILSGPRKAAMSQISGELLVIKGLDASDAINPGRESFYEENAHYRILKRVLFGSDESISGLVGKAIRSILDRIHVRAQVADKLGEARARRKTLVDISSAVSFYSRSPGSPGDGLNAFFRKAIRANGLASARDVPLRPGHRLAGFEVQEGTDLRGEVDIDYRNRTIRLDYSQDTWSTSIYLNGHYYDVSLKQGKPDHPICEFDNERRRIYVNWGHPVKLHMDDAAFLKSAILLRLAFHAAPSDANTMMDLALNMLAFRAE